MSDFPKLQPAFTIQCFIDPGWQVGSASRGTPLTVVPMIGGTVKSEPGFEPAINAELYGTGYDYIRADPDGSKLRLDVRAQLKTRDGEILALYYTGVINKTAEVGKVFARAEDAQTTEFGVIFNHVGFETGSAKYKALEDLQFVGSGRFVYDKNVKTMVEYKVSVVRTGQ